MKTSLYFNYALNFKSKIWNPHFRIANIPEKIPGCYMCLSTSLTSSIVYSLIWLPLHKPTKNEKQLCQQQKKQIMHTRVEGAT
jgi:hypothetical protein